MSQITSAARINSINAANATYVTILDSKLNQVRDTLGALDATRAISCNVLDTASRANAILSIPQLKGLAVVADNGAQSCSSLPADVTQVADYADSARDLTAFERLDVVSLGSGGRLALRLTRKPANSTTSLAAIIPVSELASWLGTPSDHMSRTDLSRSHVRLAIAARTLVDLSGDPTGDEVAAPSLPPNADDAAAETTNSRTNRLILIGESHIYPLSVTSFAPAIDTGSIDFRRAICDTALAAALVALLMIFFLRNTVADFGVTRFDQSIRREEFEVTYRPVIDLRSGKVAGALVEMRWRRLGDVVLPSSDFMPAVVRSGFEPQMLRYALRKCQTDLAAAYKLRPRLQLKVAIDHDTLIRPGFIDQLRRGLGGASLRPTQLVLALAPFSETDFPDRSRTVMKELQLMGLQLEVRQSTGQTTFGRNANDVAAAAVGIDIRLMQALDSHSDEVTQQARLWIQTIVAAGAQTGVKVCAYNIRSYEILKKLKDLGVDEVEGTVLSPALTPGSFMALVARAGLDWSDGQGEGTGQSPSQRKALSF